MGRPKLPTPEKYCETCGKKLERRPLSNGYEEPIASFKLRKYCSVACAKKAQTTKRLNTPTTSHETSRARARRIVPMDVHCAICGKEGYTEIHHKDHNPLNNSPENLVRLCKSCHAKQHHPRASCIVCGQPVKGHHLCSKHWQAWRKSNKRGWDTPYTAEIKRILEMYAETE